jgi:hypothetical protein
MEPLLSGYAPFPQSRSSVEPTEAAVTDVTMTEPIHQALADKEVAPDAHIVDAGYVDATLLVNSPQEFPLDLMGPVRPDVSWQAQVEQAKVCAPSGYASVGMWGGRKRLSSMWRPLLRCILIAWPPGWMVDLMPRLAPLLCTMLGIGG